VKAFFANFYVSNYWLVISKEDEVKSEIQIDFLGSIVCHIALSFFIFTFFNVEKKP